MNRLDPVNASLLAVLPNNKTPRIQQWNLQWQRLNDRNTSLNIAYVGTYSDRLTTRPQPEYPASKWDRRADAFYPTFSTTLLKGLEYRFRQLLRITDLFEPYSTMACNSPELIPGRTPWMIPMAHSRPARAARAHR